MKSVIWFPAVCFFILLGLWGSLFAEVIGIVGGGSTVSLINSAEVVIPVVNSAGFIYSVAMNDVGLSVIGGGEGGFCYGALINSSGMVTPLSTNQIVGPDGYYLDVAINHSGNAVLGGYFQFNQPFGALSDSLGNATALNGLIPNCSNFGTKGYLFSASINDSGLAVFSGAPGQNPNNGVYVGSLPPGSDTVNQELCLLYSFSNTSNMFSVDINASGQAIAGGFLLGDRYGVLFNASQISPTLVNISFPVGGQINGVAINAAGTSIAGGVDSVGAAYATLVGTTGQLLPLSGDPLPLMGTILSVDMNEGCGNAIIGGQNTATNAAYAALVDPAGKVSNIGGLPSGIAGASINSVSMNAWGVSLIGGTGDGVTAYAALVEPSGAVTSLPVSGPLILSVSIRNFVPSTTLSGNNLIFAQFINDFAPLKACYFIPSLAVGKFDQALESAAPTRNAFSLFTASNNLFFLSRGLSVHLRNHRHFRMEPDLPQMCSSSAVDLYSENIVFADAMNRHSSSAQEIEEELEEISTSNDPAEDLLVSSQRPFTLWFEALGAFASQEAQDESVGFDPKSGGFILAFDKEFGQTWQAGGGVSYLFTHVHEDKEAGFSQINQECLFFYTSWFNEWCYADASIWGGIFQTHQVRDIHMVGFDFQSSSDFDGCQLSPHLELGYDKKKRIPMDGSLQFILDPFGMVDWVNTWQQGYQETGESPFNIKQKAHYSSFLRAEAGIRFYEIISWNFWDLTLEQKGSYVYKQPFEVGKVKAFFVGFPNSFTVETLSDSQHLGALEVGCVFAPNDHRYPYGSLFYQGEFGNSYQSHQLNLEVSWDF